MTLRTHTIEKKGDKRNQIWEWEETPELLAAIEQLKKSSKAVEDLAFVDRPLYAGNKNYAPVKKKNGKSV